MYTNSDNSLLKKLDELKGVLATEKIHLAAIVETKPKNGETPPKECLNVKDYELFYSEHYFDNDTRGVVIYAHQDLNASIVKSEMCETFKDCLWLNIPTTTEDLLIGCIYRSGTREKAIHLDNDLNQMVKNMTLNAGYKNVVILGDFNFPEIKWCPEPIILTDHRDTNHPENRFIDTITEAMLHQHVNLPTRDRDGQNSKTDDLIFTSDVDLVYNVEHIGHLGASDHQILTFETVTTFQQKEYKPHTRFKYHQANFDGLKSYMDKDWKTLMANKTAEESYNLFLNEYKQACELHIPKEKIRKNNNLNKPIWMKQATLNLIRIKKRKHIKFLNTKSQNDKEAYRKARNEVTAATRRDRLCFERNISKQIRNNNKLFWRYVNSQRQTKASIPDLQRPDGSLASTDTEKANILNNQFLSVFTREDTTNIPEFDPLPFTTPLNNIQISTREVKKKLSKLKTDKSCGPDGVHPLVLNRLADTISIPLAIIYQISISTGQVPSTWKEGVVTALFKKGKKSDPANYRAITLTSIVCKILERILVEILVKHLRKNNLQSKQQHGFTLKKSTVTNLIEALNIWSEALCHGLPVDVIYLDYEKAFDKVPHQRLLRQLVKFGIGGNVLQWIGDYLKDRTQKVRINGSYSNTAPVLSGVPQGSVLGPALFLIFVADVTHIVQNFISLYADDSKLFSYILDSDTSQHTQESLQNDINNLCLWSDQMQMSFNAKKCHILHLGHRNTYFDYSLPKMSNIQKTSSSISYTYTFHPLEKVDNEKDLGVTVDDKLNFKLHISQKISKANSMLFLIKNYFQFLDADMFQLLYKSLVRPHLEYASPVWSPTTKEDIKRIESIQRRATKLVPNLSQLSYTDRLRALKLPTLEYRRTRQDLILLYNYIQQDIILDPSTNCKVCRNNSSMLTPVTSGTRGHPYRFAIKRHTSVRNRFFTARSLPIWNRLSTETVTANSLNCFKSGLRKDPSLPSPYIFSHDPASIISRRR